MEVEPILPELVHQHKQLTVLLRDEKGRSEKHKANYQLLKEQFIKLKSIEDTLKTELSSLQKENMHLLEYSQNNTIKDQEIKRKLQEKVEDLTFQIKQLDPELIKQQVQLEADVILKSVTEKLENEIQEYRQQCNHLELECSKLNTMLEYKTTEFHTSVNLLRLEYEAQINAILFKDEDQSSEDHFQKQIFQLTRENSQLKAKLVALSTELEKVIDSNDKMEKDNETLSSKEMKELVALKEMLLKLENEQQVSKKKYSRLERVNIRNKEIFNEMFNKYQEVRKKNSSLNQDYANLQRENYAFVSSFELENAKIKQQHNFEKSKLNSTITDLKIALEQAQSQKLAALENQVHMKQDLSMCQNQSITRFSQLEIENQKLNQMIAETTKKEQKLQQKLISTNLELEQVYKSLKQVTGELEKMGRELDFNVNQIAVLEKILEETAHEKNLVKFNERMMGSQRM